MRIETIGNCGEELNIGMGGDRPFLLLKGGRASGESAGIAVSRNMIRSVL